MIMLNNFFRVLLFNKDFNKIQEKRCLSFFHLRIGITFKSSGIVPFMATPLNGIYSYFHNSFSTTSKGALTLRGKLLNPAWQSTNLIYTKINLNQKPFQKYDESMEGLTNINICRVQRELNQQNTIHKSQQNCN